MIKVIISQIGGVLGIIGLIDLYVMWNPQTILHNIIYGLICSYLIVRGLEYWEMGRR